ncbi:MAG: hypothetical protein AAF317_08650 [Pseudomonadota bacterium]
MKFIKHIKRGIGTMAAGGFSLLLAGVVTAIVIKDVNWPAWAAIDREPEISDSPPVTSVTAEDQAVVRGLNFFHHQQDSNTGITVTTGVAFADMQAYADKRFVNAWCYVQVPIEGTTSTTMHVRLGDMPGDGSPVFTGLAAFPSLALQTLGVTATELHRVARDNCAFSDPQAAQQGSHQNSGGYRLERDA